MQKSKQRMRWQADELRWSKLMAASHQGDKGVYTQLLTELTGALTVYLHVQFGKSELVDLKYLCQQHFYLH